MLTKDQILEHVDALIAPERMGAEQALDVLEEIASEIEARIAGLRDDVRRAANDEG
jgi:hypothetical protein